MRIILITCLLALLPVLAAHAGECEQDTGCDPAVRTIADACGKAFTIACVSLKSTPRCDFMEHLCVVPLATCERDVCLDPPCHEPAVPAEPCGWMPCLDPPCHQPVVSADPCDPCPAGPVLAGGKHLIAEPCTCREECSCPTAGEEE